MRTQTVHKNGNAESGFGSIFVEMMRKSESSGAFQSICYQNSLPDIGCSKILFQLAIVCITGLFWERMDQSIGEKKTRTYFDHLIAIFLIGLAVYAAEGGIFYSRDRDFAIFNLTIETSNGDRKELLWEIAWSITIVFAFAIFWLGITKFRLIFRLLNQIGASSRLAQDDAWTSGMNGVFGEYKFVRVVDFKNEKFIEGRIQAFFENEDVRELWLLNVVVTDVNGIEINKIPMLYLSSKKDEIWLEFPTKLGDEHE